MYDIKKKREEALNTFEEEKSKYKLKFADDYSKKIQEFNQALGYDGSEELQKIKVDINIKIADVKNRIIKGRSERNKLEESLKFDEAEKKDNIISSLEHELENYNRRLSIVQSKINEESKSMFSHIAKELQKIAQDYRNELESIIENARADLNDRYNKVRKDQVDFNENYSPISYTITEVDNTIIQLNKYV